MSNFEDCVIELVILGPVSQKVVNCTIFDLSYDHLPTKFATVSQNLSECFYDFRFTILWLWRLLCAEVQKSINLPGPRAYQINVYIRSNKILNTVILLVFVDTNQATPLESWRRQFQSGDCFLSESSAVE